MLAQITTSRGDQLQTEPASVSRSDEWCQWASCLAAPLVGDVLPFLHPPSRPTVQVDHKPAAGFDPLLNRTCASQSHPQGALQGGNHRLVTFLPAAWHLSREAAGKSEGCRRDEEHLYWTHQIPHSEWMFFLSFIGSIIYNIESELIWFQLEYWSSAAQQCFLCCTLVRMWVSHVFLLQLSWWRPLPSPQIRREDEQAAGGLQHVQKDLLPRTHGSCDILKNRVLNTGWCIASVFMTRKPTRL